MRTDKSKFLEEAGALLPSILHTLLRPNSILIQKLAPSGDVGQYPRIASGKKRMEWGDALDKVAVGNITINSGTGTQSFTGVGFTPRLLILFGTEGSDGSVGRLMIGASDGTNEYAACIRADSTDGQRNSGTTLYRLLNDNDGTADATGTLDSFDSDGFTIDRTASAGISITLGYIAIG